LFSYHPQFDDKKKMKDVTLMTVMHVQRSRSGTSNPPDEV